jgi:hypothetical protein
MPRFVRSRAIAKAMKFTVDRLNGEDGIGAIFPAMVNALMALDALQFRQGRPETRNREARDPEVARRRRARSLLPAVQVADLGYLAHGPRALGNRRSCNRGAGPARQRLARRAPSARRRRRLGGERPGVRPGGWAFQYWNDYYPDVDDTAVVAMGLHRDDPERYRETAGTRCRVGRRHAQPSRRLGRVRCRERALLSQQHPIRRSRRAARPGHGRRVGALRRHAPADGISHRRSRSSPTASPICGERNSPTARGSAAGARTTCTARGRY